MQHDGKPFEIDEYGEWVYLLRFPEFKSFNGQAQKDFNAKSEAIEESSTAEVVQSNSLAVLSSPSDEEEDQDDDGDEIEDEIARQERLFELGLFEVTAEGPEPTSAQIRACESLIRKTAVVFRILIDHIYQYYKEHLDEFRDFFNGAPADRELLLPKISSVDGLQPLIQLIEIAIHETTRDGQALVTFVFDTTWDQKDYWDLTLWGDHIVARNSAPFPFTVSKNLGWEKLPVTRRGLRFAEFLYRGYWIGTFTIDAGGVCQRQIPCPVCSYLSPEAPELITEIRNAAPSHMLATLVHRLNLEPWIRRGLGVIAPVSFGLGWLWNPAFYWVTIVTSVVAGIAAYLDAGCRRNGWTIIALFEVGFAGLALLPKRSATTLDTVPEWTWIGLFEQFVWLGSAAIAVVWLYFLIGMARHPILRRVFWNLVAFGIVQASAVLFTAVTDVSALHLLWFTPLSLIFMTLLTARQLRSVIQRTMQQAVGMGPGGGGLEAAWREMLEKMEKSRQSSTVYESRMDRKRDSTDRDE